MVLIITQYKVVAACVFGLYLRRLARHDRLALRVAAVVRHLVAVEAAVAVVPIAVVAADGVAQNGQSRKTESNRKEPSLVTRPG